MARKRPYAESKLISFGMTNKIAEKLKQIDPNEELNDREAVEKLIDCCEQLQTQVASTDQSNEVYENLLAEHNRLKERITEESTANSEKLENLTTLVNNKNAEVEELNQTVAELQARLAMAQNPSKEKIIVVLQEPAATLMELTASRLSQKFEREITPAEILTDLFVKYTIENPCDFAFPVVISKAEAKEIVKKFRNVK